MDDEQAIVSSARRPDSERSHTQKAHGSAKRKSDRCFFIRAIVLSYGPLRSGIVIDYSNAFRVNMGSAVA